MNTYKEDYNARKAKVVEYLSQTIQFLDGQDGTAETVTALKDYRRNVEDGLFSIVLVGEFSAGKSTFLNALMHKRILPSFTSETTATVNFLRHASQAPNQEAGIVYYNDNRQETIPALTLQALERVVSTRGDTDDKKIATSVDHVDLFLDSSLLQDGVMLVDSPGLNGVADHHREITERQIQASHASIFMFSARQPGSRTDFEYLRSLKSQSGNIFLVLNMIDVINPEQETVMDVVNKLRQNYLKQFPEEKTLPEIWPVSAEAALVARDSSIQTYKNIETISTQERRNELEAVSRMGAFEKRLWQYLTQGERSREQLLGPVERCLAVLKEQRDYFQKQVTLLNESQSPEELLTQKAKLEEEIQTLNQNRQSISPNLREEVNRALQEMLDRGNAGCVRVHKEVEMAIESMDSSDELSEYANSLQHLMSVRYQRIGSQMKDALREELSRIVQNEYDTWFSALEDRMEQDASRLEIPLTTEPLALTQKTISNNLAKFEEWCTSMREKIETLEASADEMEADSLDAKIAAKNLEAAKADLKSLYERRAYLQESFVIPDVTYRTEEVHNKEWRGGLLGGLATILFGKKDVTRYETVEDDSAQRHAAKQRKAAEDHLKEEEARIQAEIDRLPVPVQSSERLALQAKWLRRKQLAAEQEYADKQREFMDQMQKNAEKACRNIRREILNYVDESQDNYTAALRQVLGQMKTGCIHAVRDLLNVNLDQQLERTQKKLEELIHLIESEGEERSQKLNFAMAQEENATALLAQGAELSAMLETQMNDHVEQETL